MKIIDKKGKLFGLINLFDLFVILVIIAGIAFIGTRLNFNETEVSVNEVELDVTFLIEDIRFETIDALTMGDQMYEYDTNLYFGEIVDFSYENHPVYIETDSGELIKRDNPDRYDVYVKIHATAVEGPFNLSIATKRVVVGRHLTLLGRHSAVDGVIVKLDEEND
jgi:hypothetical protein